MVYITGDIHGEMDIGKLSNKRFPQQKEMTKEDYVIICGDFGLPWDNSKTDRYWMNWLSDRNFTTLWIDGNHENFDLLYQLPTIDKFGGRVHEVARDVYHLDRGQVLTIDGRRFFVMGGAVSHDKLYRKEHISWWRQELPSEEEMERGISALESVNWNVDYVLTHCAPRSVQQMLASWYENDPLTGFLERVRMDLTFKRWFFGHYHIDRQINEQFVAVYNRMIPLLW